MSPVTDIPVLVGLTPGVTVAVTVTVQVLPTVQELGDVLNLSWSELEPPPLPPPPLFEEPPPPPPQATSNITTRAETAAVMRYTGYSPLLQNRCCFSTARLISTSIYNQFRII